MRDPKRIPIILDLVRQYWQKHPDARLGQLIMNMNDNKDPFNIEDSILLKKLKKELEEA